MTLFALFLSLLLGPTTLDFYFIDVEGGAATLIVTPDRESLLIDTGYYREDASDARKIAQVVHQAGLSRIDHLLVTHYHKDHIGGLSQLARLVPIGHYYDHGPASNDRKIPQDEYSTYQGLSAGKVSSLRPGDEIPLQGVEIRVVSSNGETVTGNGPANPACRDAKLREADPGENSHSVGLLLTFGRFHFLNLGDLTWNVEHRLVCPSDAIGPVDLFQVTHHGTATSNNIAVLQTIKPHVAVMNNGTQKGGSGETLGRLREAGIREIYQMHHNAGALDDGVPEDFTANMDTSALCPGQIIKASVEVGGETFSITNTRTRVTRNYFVRH